MTGTGPRAARAAHDTESSAAVDAPIRVVIADDQGLVRGGLRSILQMQSDIEVVGEAADGDQAIEQVRLHDPDVVLMDLRMPVLDGIEATRRITAASRTQVIALTTFETDEYVYGALRAGAAGFLLKDSPAESLGDAVRTVHSGHALLSPAITRRLIDAYTAAPSPSAETRLQDLTPRERDVFLAVAQGMSNAETARTLLLGEATVKSHLTSVLAKLGLRDRVHAVVYAYESGLLRPGRDLQGK
ncbi:response regulator transcription factor [Planctomonas sp. JC2975]|uniref:response regulator n=1 Tax=Planctomonas sp. JC2975 TaxID=2729626 RepID=UPI0014760F86|nr:response regulator transcription factor [Planctomonas sp. JC2975]NNC14017.1 response regulator transcription factor [Planctomonas sp. JC2975]